MQWTSHGKFPVLPVPMCLNKWRDEQCQMPGVHIQREANSLESGNEEVSPQPGKAPPSFPAVPWIIP